MFRTRLFQNKNKTVDQSVNDHALPKIFSAMFINQVSLYPPTTVNIECFVNFDQDIFVFLFKILTKLFWNNWQLLLNKVNKLTVRFASFVSTLKNGPYAIKQIFGRGTVSSMNKNYHVYRMTNVRFLQLVISYTIYDIVYVHFFLDVSWNNAKSNYYTHEFILNVSNTNAPSKITQLHKQPIYFF